MTTGGLALKCIRAPSSSVGTSLLQLLFRKCETVRVVHDKLKIQLKRKPFEIIDKSQFRGELKSVKCLVPDVLAYRNTDKGAGATGTAGSRPPPPLPSTEEHGATARLPFDKNTQRTRSKQSIDNY